jgi:hypothetical protein
MPSKFKSSSSKSGASPRTSSSASSAGKEKPKAATAKDPNVAMRARWVKKGEVVGGEMRDGKFIRDEKGREGGK